jgi:predicted dehydrogenase
MENKTNQPSRREFITTSALGLAGLSLASSSLSAKDFGIVKSAGDKIRMGFIGIGNRGSQLLNFFMQEPDVEIAALCDIYDPYLMRDRSKVDPRWLKDLGGQIPKMQENFGKEVKRYTDYRKLLEQKDIDAVCIATPDHWHAIQMIEAVKAGKDVYVEKPLTATIVEGRLMVEAMQKSGKVVAVGLNRRGSVVYQKLAGEIASGAIGKVMVGRAFRINNMFPDGIGKFQPEEPPAGFDWNTWLGPRPLIPYRYNIAPYKFRWWSAYSSQMGNWGVHYMDVIRWMLGETAPVAISAHGGKYVLDHDGDIPDTMQVTFEFASGKIIEFCIYEACGGPLFPSGEIELRGTKGTVYADENFYQINPSSKGQFQTWDKQFETSRFSVDKAAQSDSTSKGSTQPLVRNFLDCVKSRQTPLCSLEDGHRSTSFAHLANIALAVKQRLQWDPVNEKFLNSPEANKLLHYDYRSPYKL